MGYYFEKQNLILSL